MPPIRPDVVDQLAQLLANCDLEDILGLDPEGDPNTWNLPGDLTLAEVRAAVRYGRAVTEAGFTL